MTRPLFRLCTVLLFYLWLGVMAHGECPGGNCPKIAPAEPVKQYKLEYSLYDAERMGMTLPEVKKFRAELISKLVVSLVDKINNFDPRSGLQRGQIVSDATRLANTTLIDMGLVRQVEVKPAEDKK